MKTLKKTAKIFFERAKGITIFLIALPIMCVLLPFFLHDDDPFQ